MNSIESLKVALGEPLKRKIGGQEFEFHSLDVTFMPELIEYSLKTDEELLEKENVSIMVNLIKNMLKASFPENTPEDLIGRFAMKYYRELQIIFAEVHTSQADKIDEKTRSKIEELRKRIQSKNVKPIGTNQATSPS